MKKSIPVAFVIAAGEQLYRASRGGIHQIDWTKFVYMFVFIAVVELMTVHTAHRRGGPELSKRIRRTSRWLVPLAYFTTLGILALDFLG